MNRERKLDLRTAVGDTDRFIGERPVRGERRKPARDVLDLRDPVRVPDDLLVVHALDCSAPCPSCADKGAFRFCGGKVRGRHQISVNSPSTTLGDA